MGAWPFNFVHNVVTLINHTDDAARMADNQTAA